MRQRIILLSVAALLAVVGYTEKPNVQEEIKTSDEIATFFLLS